MIIELLIHGSNVDVHIRMIGLDAASALRSSDQTDELDMLAAATLQESNRSRGRTASREHRIDEQDFSLLAVLRQLTIILDGLEGIRITIQTDMTDLRGRNQAHDTVDHTQTGTQNRYNRQLLSGDDFGLSAADGRFDLNRTQRQITSNFISHEHGNLVKQLTEFLRAGFLISHQGHLVLNQRVVHHMNFGHVASSFAQLSIAAWISFIHYIISACLRQDLDEHSLDTFYVKIRTRRFPLLDTGIPARYTNHNKSLYVRILRNDPAALEENMLSRPMIDRIAFLGISWYAILIVGAILIGFAYCSYEARRLRIDQDTMIDFLLYAIPLAIICARVYYVVFRFNMYSEDLLSVFNIREGGLAIYGGVIGGLLAARIVARKHKVSVLTLLDIVVPALVLGQAIGRWGNYINMEAYGLRISEEYLQFFPFAVEIPVGDVWYWHMATFFYEFCWDLLVFVVLLVIRHTLRRRGDVFCWYLLLYCAGRTVIEGLRYDSLTFISEFVRISQVLSAIAALGVVIYFFVRIRDRISLVTVLPLVCAVLCLVTTFLGEFERGAYSTLFFFSQLSMGALILCSAAIIVLWTLDSGSFDLKTATPLLLNGLFLIGLLIAGIGRANADNTYYVSLRQSAAMLQLILCGWLLCYPFFPATTKVSDEHA